MTDQQWPTSVNQELQEENFKKECTRRRLDEILAEIAAMEITPFGYILDFLIDQGLTKAQVDKWFEDHK